ncbi:heparinase II/III family protein [Halomonas qaidamensis]|uniref:Heparinase II/III family protein n=1 Tax=Halomonas qaidamensis TaxID=2866211 RepID=A0ABY6JL30_9GAMM|nr:heparinase II/III family protein [Halomonas qaidamensis]UYV18041.1 heparinase II/III family protein [Halomonas qaidamensis]
MKELLVRRFNSHFNAKHLILSCYRIRRCWSIPLPVTSLPELDVNVRGFAQPYPWQIWCLWALEERLYALSGAALFLNDQAARERCVKDLEALSQWPRYTVANKLDLPYGHAVQLMAMALRDWIWLPETTQQALRHALQRAVEEGMPLVPVVAQELASAEELLAKPSPHQYLHNIPLIAQAALASAAEVIDHPERERLSSRFLHLYQARLALYHQGLTEGISYDGYLYNFALGWLSTQSSAVIDSIVHHPAMQDLEDQARGLACPGQIALSAEIGDVEPLEMPFVWSALARLQQWAFSSTRESLLDAVVPEQLRADALWVRAKTAQHMANTDKANCTDELTVPTIQQNTAAVTLATGLSSDDLSIVMSLSCSPMNHIQADSGTLLIGHAGCWWITDPGYQQYLKTSERDFTLGPEAHNTPNINGYGHVHKAGRLLYSGDRQPTLEGESAYAVVDLTACYPVDARVDTATRAVWRLGSDQVVVCDTVVAAPESSVTYHWHGNADAYWGEQSGAVSLYLPSSHCTLWLQSGQQPLSLAQQHRLRGSRGQCTLQVSQPSSVTYYWWSFSFADIPPEFQASGVEATLGDIRLSLVDLLPMELPPPGLEVSVHRDYLQVALCRGDEFLAPPLENSWDLNVSINGKTDHALSYSGRQWLLPIPAITTDDIVLISARPSNADTAATEIIEHFMTASEKAAICSAPLRVYTEVEGDRVTGRCTLMPGVMEGPVEYAFYLLLEGQKTQVRWYEASPTHTFNPTPEEAGKSIQIRGFVRSVEAPNHKLSATSLSMKTAPLLKPTPAMPETNNENAVDTMSNELKALEKTLLQASRDNAGKFTRDLLIVQNRLYAQLESLSWLQSRLKIKGQLPPLRGWATSPDVLLRLHAHIMATRPRVIVEFGSGASTLVIADALRQNGVGKLVSIEHSDHYGAQTLGTLQAESLEGWVDLRIGDLEAWEGEHLNPEDAEKLSRWYPVSLLEGVGSVDLLWVDGPPGATCLFSRYPALPALADKLSPNAEVWMDDTIRQEEKDICERWAADHSFELEYFPLEKGLGRLTRPGAQPVRSEQYLDTTSKTDHHPERAIGLDFSLPENCNKE